MGDENTRSSRSRLHCQGGTTKRNRHLSLTGDGLLHRHQPLPFLPDELIFHILLWLPVRSLLLFKCVCKSWKTQISDPQFAKNHFLSLTVKPTITPQRLFSAHHNHKLHKIVCIPVKPLLKNPSARPKPVVFSMEHKFSIIGSCNGLLCLYNSREGYVKLWNPSIRFETKKFQIRDCSHKGMIILNRGFGYDHVNDKYKLLVEIGDIGKMVTQIYTFGGNSWTTIQKFPCSPTTSRVGKFVSGTLNWLIAKRGVSVILSFDLEKETYNEVLLPENGGVKACNHVLGVLSNCLCVCFDSNKTYWDIWLMKKYGVVESWTKLTMIPFQQLCHRVDGTPWFAEPLLIFENIIVFHTITKFVLYNLDNGSFDDGFRCNLECYQHIYYESLISPQL